MEYVLKSIGLNPGLCWTTLFGHQPIHLVISCNHLHRLRGEGFFERVKAEANFLVMISEIEASAAPFHNNSSNAAIQNRNHNSEIGHSLVCSGKAHFITARGTGVFCIQSFFMIIYCYTVLNVCVGGQGL